MTHAKKSCPLYVIINFSKRRVAQDCLYKVVPNIEHTYTHKKYKNKYMYTNKYVQKLINIYFQKRFDS